MYRRSWEYREEKRTRWELQLVLKMKAIKSVLLTCDSAVKQILLTMNEKESFIIEDLDDFHVVIKADEEWRVRRDLEAELEKNTYSLE